ncbi:MAG: hypothetical protein RMJ59_08285 [Candidatus Nitrosocaldus sp.]|nr:hypothetical protein [Candidatus Nitrosocaldus sp.]MCS7140631.1 hypothetical protein [Candidatus Nitrosocaldus sp.]MDW7999554.1 hypothetical protein [Candidatus Nitrosocaldus sp.]MDW8276358.1 hypothetical protein [Candidatus Nitrosocaldus sp.]
MKVEGPDKDGMCWPKCTWFKCGKNVLRFRGNVLWCDWLEQECVGPSCAYASCVRSKLLAEGRCGLVIRRRTRDSLSPEDFRLDVKLKGKVAKMVREDDVI